MNFCQGEYDARASLESTQRKTHQCQGICTRDNTDNCNRYLKFALTQCQNLSFEARLNPESKLPFEAHLDNCERSRSSITALECD
jgi:hypothetical protein